MKPEEAWIDLEQPDDAVLLGRVTCPVTPDYHTWLFQRDRWLILRTKRDSTGSEGQRVLPMAAAAWLHRTIVERFWRTPDEGGLPARVYQVREQVEGETLELRRTWDLGGEPGFTLANFDRLTPSGYPQEYTMTDELLIRGGLLELLRRIASLPT